MSVCFEDIEMLFLMVVYLNFWFVSRTSVDEIGQYKVSASTCIWYPFLLKKKFFSFEVDLQFCSSFVYFFYDMFIFCPNYVNPPIFPPLFFISTSKSQLVRF